MTDKTTDKLQIEFSFNRELGEWFEKWSRKVVTGRCLVELKERDERFIRKLKEKFKGKQFYHKGKEIWEEIDKLVGYAEQDLDEQGDKNEKK